MSHSQWAVGGRALHLTMSPELEKNVLDVMSFVEKPTFVLSMSSWVLGDVVYRLKVLCPGRLWWPWTEGAFFVHTHCMALVP